MLGQNTQENWDFYLINEANKDDFDKDWLNFDYQSAIEEINFFSSYNLLEDDLTVSKSKEFAGDLQNKDRFSIDEEEIIEWNFGNKETLASPVLKQVIATKNDKEINSQSISCLIEAHKDEKFDEKSDISNEAQESENLVY